jgi:hypothetical protein
MEQVILFRGAGMGLHRQPEIAGFLAKAYETLQFKANKTAASVCKINGIEVIQAGLISGLLGVRTIKHPLMAVP